MIIMKVVIMSYSKNNAGSTETAPGGVLWEKMLLNILQNPQENACARVSFLIKLQGNFIKKETLAQVFSCEFFEISKNTFFIEHLWVTVSRSTLLKEKFFLNK